MKLHNKYWLDSEENAIRIVCPSCMSRLAVPMDMILDSSTLYAVILNRCDEENRRWNATFSDGEIRVVCSDCIVKAREIARLFPED